MQNNRLQSSRDSDVTNIRDYLKQYSGTDIIYCANPGNAGDALIQIATLQLFKSYRIRYRIVPWDTQQSLANSIVFFGGGGNLIPDYQHARRFILRYHKQVRKFVVLPSTIAGHPDLLTTLGANVEVFCRERVSYDYVSQICAVAKVYLSHDLVFSLDLAQLARPYLIPRFLFEWLCCLAHKLRLPFVKHRLRTRQLLHLWAACRAHALPKKNQPQSLNAFRTDVEALRTSLPANNVDLSRLFSIDTYPPRYSHLTSHAFLATLRRVNSVSTDRLHVCIAAALLGKEVSFHANKYFKNRAVYETSLAGHFPNVRWADESTDLPLS